MEPRLLSLLVPTALLSLGAVPAPPSQDDDVAARAERVLASEAAIESLRGPVGELSRSVRNLVLPDAAARRVFAARLDARDLGERPAEGLRPIAHGTDLSEEVAVSSWPTTGLLEHTRESIDLWRGFLSGVDLFEHARFYTRRGEFLDADRTVFQADSGFAALARLPGGRIAWVRAELDLRWRRSGASDEPDAWSLELFATESFETTVTTRPFFEDVLGSALTDRDLERATRSLRDEFLVDWVSGIRAGDIDLDESIEEILGMVEDGSYADDSAHVCVVDVDRDGYDDVYLMPANATAMLLRNQGDGTFRDVAADHGLDLEGVGAAVFADFDNDGDSDAFLSFYPGSTRYLEHTGDAFEERRALAEGELPGLVLTMGAVDVDNDGLLDVYLGRYNGVHIGSMAAKLERERRRGEESEPRFPGMEREESAELARRLFDDPSPFVDTPGPPNVLLRNVGGGRFERTSGQPAVAPYYQTMAASWSDVDLDGDLDLYVVNEAGPNQLVRNDGPDGFVDVTAGDATDVGFGMGVAFGDYDDDGRPDVYVTNMYSKAGQRIAAQMGSEERIVASARGNTLLRNTEDGFVRVSGLDADSVQVEAADFGWGAAFLDVNNDASLDLYAPAGYVTMPAEVSAPGDS
jgi:hypothetical protein